MGTRHVEASFGQVHQLPQIQYTNETQRDADTVFSSNPSSLFQSVFITDLQELQMLLSNTPGPNQWATTMANPTPGIDTVLAVGQAIDGSSRRIDGENASDLEIEFFDTDLNNFSKFSRIFLDQDSAVIGRGDGVSGSQTDEQSLKFSDAQILITDSKNERGAVYASDIYRTKFVDRSLVDKRFVTDLTGPGSIYTADGMIDNTLRVVTGESQASLKFEFFNTDSTDFANLGEIFIIPQGISIKVEIGDGAGFQDTVQSLVMSSGGNVFEDSTFEKGLEYASDYSINFSDRSLIDKAYADAQSLYKNDGTISSTPRIVTGESGASL